MEHLNIISTKNYWICSLPSESSLSCIWRFFNTKKKSIAKLCELMFVTVFPSRSLRRTWIISFTSVIRYYMKSRHVFKPTAYLKKFSILWVVSWTLFIAIFRSLKWLITVLSCMITSRIEWRPLPQTWQCLLESLLVPGLLHMQVNWNNCFCHLQQG